MNRLSTSARAKILTLLVEGVSINATCRITDASKNTILKLLADAGAACQAYQDRTLRNLSLKKIQVDEIWGFVGMKQRNVAPENDGILGFGDAYVWTAIDADTKLIPCWLVGKRTLEAAHEFIDDLASRLADRTQITSDGLTSYISAIEDAFGANVDFGMLIKSYGNDGQTTADSRRYSPAECTGTKKRRITGNPNMKDVSTSYIERSNLTMRMSMRRMTRLTNGFSKKLENHMHAVSLHFMHYNFCRIHQTLRVTPAMEAGIADYTWDMEDVVLMMDTNS